MQIDTARLLRALLESDYESQRRRKPRRRIVVALSRGYGCGGEKIAKRLAQKLGVPYYDKEIVDAVAQAANVERHLMERLDESVQGMRSAWLASIISGRSAMAGDYRRNLVNVVLGMARTTGGVIVGRGANLILRGEHAFRVRIVGSLSVCAERLMAQRDIDLPTAEEAIIETEKERARFVRELFARDVDDNTTFDLVINTDRLSFSHAQQLILLAMRFAGFDVPARVFR